MCSVFSEIRIECVKKNGIDFKIIKVKYLEKLLCLVKLKIKYSFD